jgi:hypothetical protein
MSDANKTTKDNAGDGRDAAQNNGMGPQSQQRMNQAARTRRAQPYYHSHPNKKSKQTTIEGTYAFDPSEHCQICSARAKGMPPPHRKHHENCPNNQKTKGLSGQLLKDHLAAIDLEHRNNEPITPGDGRHTAKDVAELFKVRKTTTATTTTTTTKPPPATTMTTLENISREKNM